ncbi:ATP-binding protein [Candidatus Albibeggiatoa sp. nov. NOAA]|uniref:ATP-binding protein n=1 Tax=Candidatus Albibeggiatoa sp. nov. NOAA TaxID=3162724 RepID=UPI0032F114D2|nr:ATP-binding protein [Thiotrichaceae bacterium]
MRAFRDISIKSKLSTIILATSAIVLLLASSAFVTNELFTLRRSIVADLFTVADIIGLNSSGALLFYDSSSAEENLTALTAKPHILRAHLFTKDGNLFASYFREDLENQEPAHPTVWGYYAQNSPEAITKDDPIVKDSSFFHNRHIEVFKNINFDDEFIGTIYVQSDLDELDERLFWAAAIIFSIMLASMLLAYILASTLQSFISQPIYSLLSTMKMVSKNKNYSIREKKLGNDELGSLVDGFNEMLSQVEQRDLELKQYRVHLEEKVQQRTAELAEARDQALAANKAKSVFLANMSHEIRTPMNAVLGYAQILQRDSDLTKYQRDALQIVETSGNHLLGLINDILDISKIEAGAMEIRDENFYLDELVDAISAMFKIRCEQKRLGWHVENEIYEKVTVYGDQGKLRQILINLLGNAVKFTEKGEVVLRVAYGDKPDYYRFDVLDTGRGIDVVDQGRIFEPFQQETSGYDKGGTGLGLAITKRQIELMNGELSLKSELGEGSVFTALLPFAKGEGEVEAHGNYQQVSRVADGYDLLAIVVDDVEENRDILSHVLRDIGIDTVEAHNGQECIDILKEREVDIIFTDIRMPVMGGEEMIVYIRQHMKSDVPCIAISASTLAHQTQEMLDSGFNHFISKPFRFEAVYECLEKQLNIEFIYKNISQSDVELDTKDVSIVTNVQLSDALFNHLYEAAKLNDLTELEALVTKLTSDAATQAFGEQLSLLLDDYDTEGILEILNDLKHREHHDEQEDDSQHTDHSSLEMSKTDYVRLENAVKLNDISELEDILAELQQQKNKALRDFALRMDSLLSTYDIEGIEEYLATVQCIDEA